MTEEERNKKIDDLIKLHTCPHCEEMKHLDVMWNGIKMCMRCRDMIWSGRNPRVVKDNVNRN